VHVANVGSDDVHAFRVDANTGALTFSGAAFTDDRPVGLAVDPRQRFALVVSEGAHTVQTFAVDATTGALTPAGASQPVVGTPMHAAYDPSGRFAYVVVHDAVLPDDGWILTFSIDPVTGLATQIDAQEAGRASCCVAISPHRRVRLRSRTAATARRARHDLRVPSPARFGHPGARRHAGHGARHHEPRVQPRRPQRVRRAARLGRAGALRARSDQRHPDDRPAGLGRTLRALVDRGRSARRFVWAAYTGNAAMGEIDLLPIQPGGALGLSMQEIVDGTDPMSLSLDASGRFLYAANSGSNDVSVISVDPSTGLMTVHTPMLAGTEPVAVVASGSTN
jgi:6-phosphogluconolactonase (cycloisomerase 2 family)